MMSAEDKIARMQEEEAAGAAAAAEKPLFRDLDPDEGETDVTEIESLCLNCYKQGTTKLLLTKIPHFREVIISSFSCENCAHRNCHIDSAGCIQETGVRYTLSVHTIQDLNRQVVKSDTATLSIPHLDFEQPPNESNKGEVSTVEGLINSVIEGLLYFQPQRQQEDPSTAAKIADFVLKLKKLNTLQQPFDLVVDDPSGNSFIENPSMPARDDRLNKHNYTRTTEQNLTLGLQAEDPADCTEPADDGQKEEMSEDKTTTAESTEILKEEVLQFQNNCPSCNSPCVINMKLIDIPFFKEVVVMATNCDRCGLRDNEVKGGSGIEEKGSLIKLRLTDPSDLNRDVLKSDTCGLSIPELDLELEHGTLGGRFTTVEGILKQIKNQLSTWNPFIVGDSATSDMKEKLTAFVTKLDQVINGEMLNVHLVLDDPAGNSYIQNVYAPDTDPEMSVECYVRNFYQNELLGLNDMKTENYEDSADS